jgi:hypothetical protein
LARATPHERRDRQEAEQEDQDSGVGADIGRDRKGDEDSGKRHDCVHGGSDDGFGAAPEVAGGWPKKNSHAKSEGRRKQPDDEGNPCAEHRA